MTETYYIYFAGDLFNHKDLIGNLLLSEAIEKESSGRFICVVPQHLEQSTNRSIDIRNSDLSEVVKADLILLNFDGTELDSGTVVEFMFAKALDIPMSMLFGQAKAAPSGNLNHWQAPEGSCPGLASRQKKPPPAP